jgi:hypothetical protein
MLSVPVQRLNQTQSAPERYNFTPASDHCIDNDTIVSNRPLAKRASAAHCDKRSFFWIRNNQNS